MDVLVFDIFSSQLLGNIALCKYELKNVNVCSHLDNWVLSTGLIM